ncbi:hypothetical protein GCM10010246_81900 [Streptomyces cuspidosporus]|uniref:Uncharacterized protein n=1 Tax=Streptomyces cuspidosporus TaxID=66882 RepID=A0ABP5UCM6_9ACTN
MARQVQPGEQHQQADAAQFEAEGLADVQPAEPVQQPGLGAVQEQVAAHAEQPGGGERPAGAVQGGEGGRRETAGHHEEGGEAEGAPYAEALHDAYALRCGSDVLTQTLGE